MPIQQSLAYSPAHMAGIFFLPVLLLLMMQPVHAVPSFARQTKLDCMTCHVSWPELTPTGRLFKLNGYTLGEQLRVPLAGMLQVSRTSTANVDPRQADNFPKDRELVLQQASVFVSGKLAEQLGIFSQVTYDGVAHHTSIDNLDLRYAQRFGESPQATIAGVTLHNNPMVQDIYNTGPTWGFPFASSPVALAPNAGTVIESLGQQVAGFGAYALWHNTVYAELSAYRTADKAFSLLRAGTDHAGDAALRGLNPYWRLALQHEWGAGMHSAMIGTYGININRYPDSSMPFGSTDRLRDIGFDAQYQYITDRHRFSAQLNTIRENQRWNASSFSNQSDVLKSFRSKLSYYYQKQYGINLSYFSLRGNGDDLLYNTGAPISGSAGGSPNSNGYVVELNYLPRRDIRIALQYTGYTRFNGAASNYDGFGRNARNNNTLYLMTWLMF
ncbi:MAG: cytochrome C [Pseudomonadota bacterium]